jgi:hypothetical protein
MRLKVFVVAALAAASLAVLAGTATPATAAPARGTITAPINATTATGSVINGVFQVTGFTINEAGQLVANGVLNGTLTDASGTVTNLVNTAVSSVVTNQATGGGCQILDLTLGPLHLDLLGLVVDLNQVHLNITAQPGPGNLLGNLLCGVSHLLDNGSSSGLANLLSRLNALLGGVLGGA